MNDAATAAHKVANARVRSGDFITAAFRAVATGGTPSVGALFAPCAVMTRLGYTGAGAAMNTATG